MTVTVSSYIDPAIFKSPRISSDEQQQSRNISEQSVSPIPTIALISQSQATTPDYDDDDVIIDREIPIEELEGDNARCTLGIKEDQNAVDVTASTSFILPDTPEIDSAKPNTHFVDINEDSMGFGGLAAMNFNTPHLQSTQTYFDVTKRPSPIKRTVNRNVEDQPLNSTQAFFDIDRHYKLLSKERKRPAAKEERNELRPVRRRLFSVSKEEHVENTASLVTDVSNIDIQKEDKLESFEDAWNNTKTLKANGLKSEEKKAKVTNPFILKEVNNSDAFVTPQHLIVKSENSIVSDMPQTENVLNNSFTDIVGDEITVGRGSTVDDTQPVACLPSAEELVNQESDPPTSNDVSKPALSRISLPIETKTTLPRIKIPITRIKIPIVCAANTATNETKEPNPALYCQVKKEPTTRRNFLQENRIYKRTRIEEQEDAPINCPEIVKQLFRQTDTPTAFPTYPPSITRVVPIPIPDEPKRRKAGLSRRAVRNSLHPYLARNLLHEE